jgi:tetratricopeptide (TPR) repeat protein
MKFCYRLCSVLLVIAAFFVLSAPETVAQSRTDVSGFILGVNNQGIENAQVELLNDVNRVIARTRSDASGKYSFIGAPTGRLSVRVLPLGTNYEGETRTIEQLDISVRGRSMQSVQLDFRLRMRRSGASGSGAVIFAQDVPEAARKIFEDAVGELDRKNTDKGIARLIDAVEAFPTYFRALERLGQEFVAQQQFEKARLSFEQAAQVNSRSFATMYGLALTSFSVGRYKQAFEAAEKAVVIDKTSVGAHYILGRSQRQLKMYEAAEKSLLEARKYDNGATPDILWELALLSAHNLKKYASAADYLEAYLNLNPKNVETEKIRQLIAQFRGKG